MIGAEVVATAGLAVYAVLAVAVAVVLWHPMAATVAEVATSVREAVGDAVTWVRAWWGVSGRHVRMGAYVPVHGATA